MTRSELSFMWLVRAQNLSLLLQELALLWSSTLKEREKLRRQVCSCTLHLWSAMCGSKEEVDLSWGQKKIYPGSPCSVLQNAMALGPKLTWLRIPAFASWYQHPFEEKHTAKEVSEHDCVLPWCMKGQHANGLKRKCHVIWNLSLSTSLFSGNPINTVFWQKLRPFQLDPGRDLHRTPQLWLQSIWEENMVCRTTWHCPDLRPGCVQICIVLTSSF